MLPRSPRLILTVIWVTSPCRLNGTRAGIHVRSSLHSKWIPQPSPSLVRLPVARSSQLPLKLRSRPAKYPSACTNKVPPLLLRTYVTSGGRGRRRAERGSGEVVTKLVERAYPRGTCVTTGRWDGSTTLPRRWNDITGPDSQPPSRPRHVSKTQPSIGRRG
jgi:hypothetical protein